MTPCFFGSVRSLYSSTRTFLYCQWHIIQRDLLLREGRCSKGLIHWSHPSWCCHSAHDRFDRGYACSKLASNCLGYRWLALSDIDLRSLEKCLKVFCEGSLEEAFGAFIDLGAESSRRSVSLDHRWALGRAEYGGPAPLLEKRFFAFLGVVRMLRSSSTLCCKLSTKVLVVVWRPFASLMTSLRGFADHHLRCCNGRRMEGVWDMKVRRRGRGRQDGRRGD